MTLVTVSQRRSADADDSRGDRFGSIHRRTSINPAVTAKSAISFHNNEDDLLAYSR